MAEPLVAGIDPAGWFAERAIDAAGSLAEPIFAGLGASLWRWLSEACAEVGREIVGALSGTGGIDLTSGWWAGPRTREITGVVVGLAAALTIAFLLLTLIQGLIAGDPIGMVRTALGQVPLSILGMVGLVGVTDLLVRITDAASAAVLAGAPEDLRLLVERYGTTAALATGGIAGLVLLIVFLLGALLVWMELVVRSALVHLLLAFAPLVLAARVWPATRGMFRRLCELGVALIVSKFVVSLTLALGAAALAGGGSSTEGSGGLSLAGLLAGATLMGLAAFTPFVVLRLLPIVETAMVAHGISRSPVQGARLAKGASAYPARLARMAGGAALAAGAAGLATGRGTAGAAAPTTESAAVSATAAALGSRRHAGAGPGRRSGSPAGGQSGQPKTRPSAGTGGPR